MQKKSIIIWCNCVAPIAFGSCIYILFRTKTLYAFKWIDYIGGDNIVNSLRMTSLGIINIIPYWVKYSLPDALWVYSLTFAMGILWYGIKSNFKYIILLVGPTIGILSELAQYFHLIPGTFDLVDLLCCTIASLLPFYVINKLRRGKYYENKT